MLLKYALLEVATPPQEGRLPVGPWLDLEAESDRNRV